jgi:hypothetical protein
MVVHLNFKSGERIIFSKVVNISLLDDGKLCLQRNDKRFKNHFREELIPIADVQSFYSHG